MFYFEGWWYSIMNDVDRENISWKIFLLCWEAGPAECPSQYDADITKDKRNSNTLLTCGLMIKKYHCVKITPHNVWNLNLLFLLVRLPTEFHEIYPYFSSEFIWQWSKYWRTSCILVRLETKVLWSESWWGERGWLRINVKSQCKK